MKLALAFFLIILAGCNSTTETSLTDVPSASTASIEVINNAVYGAYVTVYGSYINNVFYVPPDGGYNGSTGLYPSSAGVSMRFTSGSTLFSTSQILFSADDVEVITVNSAGNNWSTAIKPNTIDQNGNPI